MKRFFCTTCDAIRHVRVLPNDVINPLGDKPRERIGNCRWHTAKQGERRRLMSRVKITLGLGSTRRTSASSAKSKSKK